MNLYRIAQRLYRFAPPLLRGAEKLGVERPFLEVTSPPRTGIARQAPYVGEKPYLRSVKQVDTNPSRPTFQPPLMTGLSEQGVSLSQPLPPHSRRSLSGLWVLPVPSVAPRIRQAAPLVALLRDEEEAGYFYSDLAQLLGDGWRTLLPLSLSPCYPLWAPR